MVEFDPKLQCPMCQDSMCKAACARQQERYSLQGLGAKFDLCVCTQTHTMRTQQHPTATHAAAARQLCPLHLHSSEEKLLPL